MASPSVSIDFEHSWELDDGTEEVLNVRGSLTLEDQSFDYEGPFGPRTHRMPPMWTDHCLKILNEAGKDIHDELWELYPKEHARIEERANEEADLILQEARSE